MKNSYIIGLFGLLAAIATVLGLRSCSGEEDIFEPGERVITDVDWGQYSPKQFDGKIFTYARKTQKGTTVVILVPFAAGSKIEKDHDSADGADGYKIVLRRTTGGTGQGVYQLTIDGIPETVEHVRVELTGGEGHDIVLADADDESFGTFDVLPVPLMRVERSTTTDPSGNSNPDVVEGFLVLPDRSTVIAEPVSTAGVSEAVLKVKVTTTSESLELYFMSIPFSPYQVKNKVALVVNGHDGRTWTYLHR